MRAETRRSEGLVEILEWPSVLETSQRVDRSLNYVYGLIWRRKLAAQKIGGVWRVSPDAIADYLAKSRPRGSGDAQLAKKEARNGH